MGHGGGGFKGEELRAMTKAMTERSLKDAPVVTDNGEGEITVNGGTVRLVPTWRFLLGRVWVKPPPRKGEGA